MRLPGYNDFIHNTCDFSHNICKIISENLTPIQAITSDLSHLTSESTKKLKTIEIGNQNESDYIFTGDCSLKHPMSTIAW